MMTNDMTALQIYPPAGRTFAKHEADATFYFHPRRGGGWQIERVYRRSAKERHIPATWRGIFLSERDAVAAIKAAVAPQD